MSKFHDEFFRKRTPDHDELVALTIENMEEILLGIWTKIITQRSWEKLWVCRGGYPWCDTARQIKTVFNHEPACFVAGENVYEGKYPSGTKFTCPKCGFTGNSVEEMREHDDNMWRQQREYGHGWEADKLGVPSGKGCKHLKVKEQKTLAELFTSEWQKHVNHPTSVFFGPTFEFSDSDRKLLKRVSPHVEATLHEKKAVLKEIAVDNYETEKICKSGSGFIYGYIDLVFDVEIHVRYDVVVEEGWVWENFDQETKRLKFVVEAKPKLIQWGGPLRQIKTYMDNIRSTRNRFHPLSIYGLIVTFSDVNSRYRRIMRKENVFVYQFKRGEGNVG